MRSHVLVVTVVLAIQSSYFGLNSVAIAQEFNGYPLCSANPNPTRGIYKLRREANTDCWYRQVICTPGSPSITLIQNPTYSFRLAYISNSIKSDETVVVVKEYSSSKDVDETKTVNLYRPRIENDCRPVDRAGDRVPLEELGTLDLDDSNLSASRRGVTREQYIRHHRDDAVPRFALRDFHFRYTASNSRCRETNDNRIVDDTGASNRDQYDFPKEISIVRETGLIARMFGVSPAEATDSERPDHFTFLQAHHYSLQEIEAGVGFIELRVRKVPPDSGEDHFVAVTDLESRDSFNRHPPQCRFLLQLAN